AARREEIRSGTVPPHVAGELGIDSYGQIPLEAVAANAIDILIVSASRDGPPALARKILRHPVLSALSDRPRVVVMPGRLWNCGGPAVVEAIERLMQAAGEVRAEAPQKGDTLRRSMWRSLRPCRHTAFWWPASRSWLSS